MLSIDKKCIRRAAVERVTFAIQAENRAEVLARVVLLFHRLNVEITALYIVRRRRSERWSCDAQLAAVQINWQEQQLSGAYL